MNSDESIPEMIENEDSAPQVSAIGEGTEEIAENDQQNISPEADESDGRPCEEMSEVEALKSELEHLKGEFEEKKKAFERLTLELNEFSEVFPDKNVSTIPDSVWDEVKKGIPLAAAYALYERRSQNRIVAAELANAKNRELSTGPIGRETTENFFTPDEVRAMSRTEVRKNYSKIIESMKKWN